MGKFVFLRLERVQPLKRDDGAEAFFSLDLGKIAFDVRLPAARTTYRGKQFEGLEPCVKGPAAQPVAKPNFNFAEGSSWSAYCDAHLSLTFMTLRSSKAWRRSVNMAGISSNVRQSQAGRNDAIVTDASSSSIRLPRRINSAVLEVACFQLCASAGINSASCQQAVHELNRLFNHAKFVTGPTLLDE